MLGLNQKVLCLFLHFQVSFCKKAFYVQGGFKPVHTRYLFVRLLICIFSKLKAESPVWDDFTVDNDI